MHRSMSRLVDCNNDINTLLFPVRLLSGRRLNGSPLLRRDILTCYMSTCYISVAIASRNLYQPRSRWLFRRTR